MTEWEQCLTDAGCRITAPRRAVMQVLLTASMPLSPREILERGRRVHHKLGLVTVYRTVNLLAEMSLVRRIHCEDDCRGYQWAGERATSHLVGARDERKAARP